MTKIESLTPKILIACPTSERHKHLLDEWLIHLDSLDYPNFDVMMIDTSESDEYFKILKTKKVKGKNLIVKRMKWDSKKNHVLQHLAYVRDEIRKYFLENDYFSLFFLDDDIFIPKNGIQKLLSYNKDCVGFYVHIFDKAHRKPCVFKSGEMLMGTGIDLFKFKEIDEYKKFVKKFKEGKLSEEEKNLVPFLIEDENRPQLVKVYATGIGCLMISRKVLEAVPFRTHHQVILGEDIWFFSEANDKNFKFYVDTSVRAKHKNTDWNIINEKCSREMKMYLAYIPENPSGIEFLQRGKK